MVVESTLSALARKTTIWGMVDLDVSGQVLRGDAFPVPRVGHTLVDSPRPGEKRTGKGPWKTTEMLGTG